MNSKVTNKYIIVGSDSFIDSTIKNILEPYNEIEIDKKTYFGDEFDNDDFVFFISSLPLFCDLKLAVVKKAEKVKNFDELTKTIISSESLIIICTNNENFLKKYEKHSEFSIINEPKKGKFTDITQVINLFSQLGIKLSKPVAEEIYETCNKDFGIINNELEKLKIFYNYEKPKTESEILEKISHSKQENVFNFIDNFFDKKKKSCYNTLVNMINYHENLNQVFYMFSKRLLNIITYKINPSLVSERQFILEKIKKNAANWSFKELSKCSDMVLNTDIGSKTGKIDIENGLISLLDVIERN